MKRLKFFLLFISLIGVMLLVACASAETTTVDTSSDTADTAEVTSTEDAAVAPTSDDNAEESAPPTNSENETQPAFETVEVADGLYSFGNGEAYGAFLVTDEGVIVMDSINTNFATQMLAAIRELTDQPIVLLIYSHNHWDHSGGGQVFKDEGATVIAHRDAHDSWRIILRQILKF